MSTEFECWFRSRRRGRGRVKPPSSTPGASEPSAVPSKREDILLLHAGAPGAKSLLQLGKNCWEKKVPEDGEDYALRDASAGQQ